MDTIKLFKCLADKSRLKLIQALLEKPAYVEILSERLELSASTVSFHLKKLQEVGLVTSEKDQYYTMYTLNADLLNQPMISLIQVDQPAEKAEGKQNEEEYRKKVLKSFIKYRKLKQIPVQMKKRQIVMEHLVEDFEKGVDYTEKEVNDILKKRHEDFCTLRRELVVLKLLDRQDGVYTRSK